MLTEQWQSSTQSKDTKMKKIEWTWSANHKGLDDFDLDLQDWLEPINYNKHDWVKSQPPNLWKKALQKTAELYFNYKPKTLQSFKQSVRNNQANIRDCVGIKKYLNNCFCLRSPHEAFISINNDGRYHVEYPDNSQVSSVNPLSIESHDIEQWGSVEEDNPFPNCINLKFVLPVQARFPKGTWGLTLDALFEKDKIPAKVCHGMIGDFTHLWTHGGNVSINLNTFWEIPKSGTKECLIKSGQPLGYLFCSEKMGLKYNPKIMNGLFRKNLCPLGHY